MVRHENLMEHERSRRPWVISGLALALMLAPALQAASLAGLRVLNFAPELPLRGLCVPDP